MMIGICGCSCLNLFMKASPSVPGIRISVITTSGSSLCSALIASSALPKVETCKSACCNARSRTQRIDWSSSMTQILSCFTIQTLRCVIEGEKNREYGFAGFAVALDQAAVQVDQRLRNGQAEACSLGTAGNHRIKNLLEPVGWNA